MMDPEDEQRIGETRSSTGESPAVAARSRDSAAAWEIGAVVLERFVVERELGRGGMGVVHLLRNQDTHEPYAVKRSQQLDDAHRARFLLELQVWEQLPDHPNLIRCRFFKTIGDQLAIFAEFVNGTTLDGLLRSGFVRDTAHILDLSIQVARGLAAAHAAGVVHRDVKPSNVIVTPEGVARVTDFGLSYSRSFSPRSGREPLGTLPYRSPEQAERKATDERTDIWSFGVCVLALLKGGCAWVDGVLAPRLLDDLRRPAAAGPSCPVDLATLLDGCFREDPEERWESMERIALELERVYGKAVGGGYPRPRPARVAAAPTKGVPSRVDVGRFWERVRLRIGPRVPVGDVSAAAAAVTAGGAGEIAAIDGVRRLLERLVAAEGRSDLVKHLVETDVLYADAHRHAGDAQGALDLYRRGAERCQRLGPAWDYYRGFLWASFSSCAADECQDLALAHDAAERAIQVLEPLLDCGRDPRAAQTLALAWLTDAIALLRRGEPGSAKDACARSARLLDGLLSADGEDVTLLQAQATLRRTRAECFSEQGDLHEADAEISQAMEIFARLASLGVPGIAQELATTDLNRSNYLSALGRLDEALLLAERAASVWEALIEKMGRGDLRGSLARARKNEAALREKQGDVRGALRAVDQALFAYELLVDAEGRLEHELGLAQALHNKAVLLRKLSRLEEARALLERARRVYERAARGASPREGRLGLAAVEHACGNISQAAGELPAARAQYDAAISNLRAAVASESGQRSLDAAKELARAHYNRSTTLRGLGRHEEAHQDLDRALEIQEDIVLKRGYLQLIDDLALTYLGKAGLFQAAGNAAAAVTLCRRAVALLSDATDLGGRQDLRPLLATALEAQALCSGT